MRTARLAGHYLNVMATASVLAIVIHPLFGLPVQLDLLGIALGFWTGFGILNGRRGFRTGMLILTLLGMTVGGGFLVYLAWANGPVGGRELRTPELAAVQMTAVLLIMLPLPALLLMPSTRRWFEEARQSPPPRYRLTSKMIGLYILAGVLINALPVALDKWPHKAEPEGKSGGFTYGNDETGMVSVQWLEDKASNRPLFVSYLAFAESRSFGSQDREGRISFDSHYVDVPKLKPVRYLFTPPAADESQPNILIVKKDGTVIRIARRVPPDQVDSTINAANGVRDFDELKTRLEALLPAPAIAAR